MPYPYLLRANKRILIELAPKTLTLFASDEPLFSSPIAIGKSQTPTPLGEWKVINKKILDPRSVFGSRWLGLSLSGYGIHGTNNPLSIGTAASLGCIRMHNKDIEELFAQVSIGTPVKIIRASTDTPTHQLQAGDTIYKISQKYNLAPKQLLLLNPAIDPLNLPIGKVLSLRKKY